MNFGRQLKRVKQQADHLFLRSDRTDVVGELRSAEEQVEELRVLCEAYSRSLEKCLHTHTTPDEKKLKKVPEYQAAETLKEALAQLPPTENPDHQDLLRTVVGRVVELQQALGMNQVEYEDALERQVLGPLTHLIKDDFPSVAKQKKQLKQVGLDVDAAKTRWKNSQANPGPNAKMDTYREELEEAETKLDQTKDSYACDIFSLLAREREVSQYVCSYISLQREHLQRALAKLDLVLPDVQTQMEASLLSPVFGVPLHDHLKIAHQDVAVVVRVCVRHLVEFGVYEEGLLRVAGSATKVRRLKGAFDAGLVTPELLAAAGEYDPHVVAGALKCYLRELPEPLLTHLLHSQWLDAVRQPDHHYRLRALWTVANQLPPAHLTNLAFLVKFLALVAANSTHNKMTPGNIATVVAPNLIWDQREEGPEAGPPDVSTLGRSVSLAGDYRGVVEHLVEYCDYFFKEEVDLGAMPPSPPSPPRPHHEPNGAIPLAPATGTLPRPAPATHRRNISADLTVRGELPAPADPCESPKQPQRTKKKQAPRPPQVRPASTHGAPAPNGQEAPLPSDSPETIRSGTPPRDGAAPTPATRLHHTNSLRRPTAEPPKPPGAPTKPPRPSPPASEALERSAPGPPRAPLGFEQLHLSRESDSAGEEGEVVVQMRGSGDEPCPIGFLVEGEKSGGAGRSVQAFRQSLENVIQQQAAGQPHPLPRHPPSSTTQDGGEPNPALAPLRPAPAAIMPPTPAQRTTIPTTQAPHKPPETKTEKPALKEKPNIMARSLDPATAPSTATLPRPVVPDRPAPLLAPSTAPATHHRPATAFQPSATYNLPPPAAPQTQEQEVTTTGTSTTVKITTSDTKKKKEEEEAEEEETQEGGGGGGQVETANLYSLDKQQPTVIHVTGNPSQAEHIPPTSLILRPTKPVKPEKPSLLPRPASLSPEALDALRIPSPSLIPGPITRTSSSGSSGGSGGGGSVKFCWPPPQPTDTTTTTTTTTATTATATIATATTTSIATDESASSPCTGDSTNL